MIQWKMESPVGPLYIVASEKALRGIYWKKQNIPMANSPEAYIAKTVRQLEEYFRGKRKNFDLVLDVEGTEFQKQVWQQLSKIPYGKTCSYADIAKRIKNHKAVRAVGTANGRNPVSIVVPCHRVIASDGSLGGYAGGLDIKTTLLNLEKNK